MCLQVLETPGEVCRWAARKMPSAGEGSEFMVGACGDVGGGTCAIQALNIVHDASSLHFFPCLSHQSAFLLASQALLVMGFSLLSSPLWVAMEMWGWCCNPCTPGSNDGKKVWGRETLFCPAPYAS